MELVVIFALTVTLGLLVAYHFSAARKLRSRLRATFSPLEELNGECRDLQQSMTGTAETLAAQYIQSVFASRLKATSVDELKKHASGMRLQALKDSGVRTLADLQGWTESRVLQVPGIGPKSAGAIVRATALATAEAKSIPIPHPVPPFAGALEQQLVRSIYGMRRFETHVSERAARFATVLASKQAKRDTVLETIGFTRWMWNFGTSAPVLQAVQDGEGLIQELTSGDVQASRDVLSRSLQEVRQASGANQVEFESIVEDFTQNREYYERFFDQRLHKPNAVPQTSSQLLQQPSAVHVEFGRTVPGPPPAPAQSAATSPAISRQGREVLFTVSITSASGSVDKAFTIPPPPRAVEKSNLRWVPKGEPIQVRGHNLTHGFVWVGKGVDNERHYALDPDLGAASTNEEAQVEHESPANYALLPPELRGNFLAWIAKGASSITAPNLAMIYFYGLERRAVDLLQCRISDPPIGEIEQVLDEVRRLGKLFKDSAGTMTQCCDRLLSFAKACKFDKSEGPGPEPTPERPSRGWELPFDVRVSIGWFMKERKPIPVGWALRWAYVEPSIYLRTPATRCPDEFEAAFSALYRERFGDGLMIQPNKAKLKITYQCGWPMYFGIESRTDISEIPDVAAITGPQQKLKALVEEATVQVDALSRYLGRNPNKSGSLEAYLNLPFRLWPPTVKERWQRLLESHVQPIQPATLESVFRELDPAGEPSPSKVSDLAAALSSLQVGFEPDILGGARRPKLADMVVLFPLSSDAAVERTSSEYQRGSLLVSLSACVALADGHASEDEAALVEKMIDSWDHLHTDLRTRLLAQYRLQVHCRVSLPNVKSRLAQLSPDGREEVARALSALAAADGDIAAAEVKLLEQIYGLLGLEQTLLYTHLHGGRPAQIAATTPSSTSAEPSPYQIDTARLAALRRETETVSELLAGVFVEESVPNQPQVERSDTQAATTEDTLLPGLDDADQELLAILLERDTWSRHDLLSIAAQRKIMLDGALERINDAAFDFLGEPIIDGDDPVYVQQNLLEATR